MPPGRFLFCSGAADDCFKFASACEFAFSLSYICTLIFDLLFVVCSFSFFFLIFLHFCLILAFLIQNIAFCAPDPRSDLWLHSHFCRISCILLLSGVPVVRSLSVGDCLKIPHFVLPHNMNLTLIRSSLQRSAGGGYKIPLITIFHPERKTKHQTQRINQTNKPQTTDKTQNHLPRKAQRSNRNHHQKTTVDKKRKP